MVYFSCVKPEFWYPTQFYSGSKLSIMLWYNHLLTVKQGLCHSLHCYSWCFIQNILIEYRAAAGPQRSARRPVTQQGPGQGVRDRWVGLPAWKNSKQQRKYEPAGGKLGEPALHLGVKTWKEEACRASLFFLFLFVFLKGCGELQSQKTNLIPQIQRIRLNLYPAQI